MREFLESGIFRCLVKRLHLSDLIYSNCAELLPDCEVKFEKQIIRGFAHCKHHRMVLGTWRQSTPRRGLQCRERSSILLYYRHFVAHQYVSVYLICLSEEKAQVHRMKGQPSCTCEGPRTWKLSQGDGEWAEAEDLGFTPPLTTFRTLMHYCSY